MTQPRLEPFFLNTSRGRIFLLLRAPGEAASVQRCVLFVPAFAEEMNKCRRQVTETTNALVANGLSALVVDLYGTGDSEGEFSAATWDGWKSNIDTAMAWAGRAGLPIEGLVATRLGCALAAESLRDTGRNVQRTVFWQPVHIGRQYITQFLRLRVTASMMEGDAKETVDGLKARLNCGERLEVAGYELPPELWRAIENIELSASLSDSLGQLRLVEVGRARDGELSVVGRRLVDAAQERDIDTSGVHISGEPFWSTTEIVVNPELTELTVQFLSQAEQS